MLKEGTRVVAQPGRAAAALKQNKMESQLSFPFYEQQLRLTANCLSRSALFTIQKTMGEKRERLVDQPIFSLSNISIIYNGETLNQYDLEVYMAVLHQFHETQFQSEIHTTIYSILSDLGIGHGAKEYNRIKDTLRRLSLAHLTVYMDQQSKFVEFSGSLLPFYGHTEIKKSPDADPNEKDKPPKVILRINPEIAKLFQPTMYSLIDWDFHKNLSPLAKYLHCFYLSHKKPHPFTVRNLMTLTGTKSKHLSSFKQSLNKALDELKPKVIADHQIKNNTLFVTRFD